MNEIQKIEYRIQELRTILGNKFIAPTPDEADRFIGYSNGYLAALEDVLNLLKRPPRNGN